ncbi:MAG: hypothetical protein QM582_01970 [Micropruina sp.]|uniref:hypothetical protein n=1 Tax=Micropruina sp. TaxID=2737536 RepID=UPI0039E2AA14
MRSLLLGLLVLALSTIGVAAATPAHAAAHELKGTGRGSASIVLGTGIYQVTLTYTGNRNAAAPTLFGALLASTDDDESPSVLELLAVDVRAESSTRKLVQLFTRTELVFQVGEASADAPWTLTLEKVGTTGLPGMPATVSGEGLNSSALYQLKAGAYRLTSRFTGNVYPEGMIKLGFGLVLYGANGDGHLLVESTEVDGTGSASFKVAKTGAYWIHPYVAAADANWTVSVATLKQFTATPTPKISGTAKVGKTLKAKPGTWKPSGVKLSYQWYRGSSKIAGATKSSYKLTGKDKGAKVKVMVTGSKSGYLSVAKASKSTGAVKK